MTAAELMGLEPGMVKRLCAVLAERNPDTPPEAFEGDVIALLSAMDPPDKAMLDAVSFDDGELFFEAEHAESVWRGMIAACLRAHAQGERP
jgi:hypothetical protein